MNWRVVAAKDVRDASRSRTLWVLLGVLTLLFVAVAAGLPYVGDPDFVGVLDALATVAGALVPLLGLLLGYKSIADERSSGSLALTLSFPVSRRDLLVGTFVGRSIVLLVPTVVGLVLAGAVAAAFAGTDGAARYPLFVLTTALYGAAFVGIAVGLSAATEVDRWITLGAIGGYLVLVQFWTDLHAAVLLVLHRFDGRVLADLPDWSLLFRLVGPAESYDRLLRAGFELGRAGTYVGADVPAYVGAWMAVLVLFAWTVLPVAVGFWRFRNDDL